MTLISTLFLWLPFILRLNNWFGLTITTPDFHYIFGQYDGPLYIIPAKTLYDINKIDIPGQGLIVSLPLSAKYFAAHFPLYPFLIRVGAEVFGYLKSMLFVNLIATCSLVTFFYFFLKKLDLSRNPLVLAILLLFLPRFLVVRTTGAPESLFMLLVLVSLYFFEKKRLFLASLFGALATTTKSPGILLFLAYALVFAEAFLKSRKFERQWLFIFLIPVGLLSVFVLYGIQMKDFLAYFHSGDNIHLVAPFSVFNFQKNWVGTAWLEDIVFYYFLYGFTVVSLFRSRNRSLFYFSLVFFAAILLVQHRDIARYSLPLWPLALIAHEKAFTSKKFLVIFLVLLPGIFLFAWNFLLFNVMPIAEWKPFL